MVEGFDSQSHGADPSKVLWIRAHDGVPLWAMARDSARTKRP
jgi:hypothetical protein